MTQPHASGIILLGVIHYDPMGYKRTADFLSRCRPDLVLVEISPFALQYRKQNSHQLHRKFLNNLRVAAKSTGIPYGVALANPRITVIARQLHLPFEYRASAAYCAKTGAQLVPVDSSDFSSRCIATWPELISAENIEETLLRLGDTPSSISYNYDLAARAILGGKSAAFPPSCLPVSDREETLAWHKREEHIATEIRAAMNLYAPLRPLYIGGWRHLVSDATFPSLREIMGIALTSCLLLDRGRLCAGGRSVRGL